MNITLTKQQILLVAAFTGMECEDLADALPMDLAVTILETQDGRLTASYWDDTQEAAVIIPLGQVRQLNG